jgi:GMP synthase-like glutamine amidotransferase
MRVVSIVHQDNSTAGTYADVVRERGHVHVEWRIDVDPAPPEPIDALIVFGGTMDTHEEESYAWLKDEDEVIRRWLAAGVPVFGVCLGGQLLAKALDAPVSLAPMPEIGWHEVTRTPAGADDPIFAALPERFSTLQWHYYQFALPERAVPLLRNSVCLQGYRFGEAAWGVQFHPEVTRAILQEWIDYSRANGPDLDYAAFERESDLRAEEWTRLGRTMCERFLRVAEAKAG